MADIAAFEKDTKTCSFPAAADLSSSQFLCGVVNSSGQAAACSTEGEKAFGIIQDAPDAAGKAAKMAYAGISRGVAGGTFSLFDELTTNSAGKLIAKGNPSDYVIGIALSDGGANEIIPVMLSHSGRQLDSESIRYAEISITPAEMLLLYSAPKTLVAAPGAGYVNEFISMILILDYVSAAYANNGILGCYETNSSGTVLSDTVAQADFLAKTADHMVVVQALSADTVLAENKALVLTQATGESITGDSPVRVKISYRVHATGL